MSEWIQWPRAKYWQKAWNPVIGCKPVSPACENCWAMEWAERFGKPFDPHAVRAKIPPRSGVVFCGNLTDIWGDWNLIHQGGGYYHNSCDFIASTMGYGKRNPYKDRATYLWLTKRAGTMAEWVSDGGWEEYHDYWTGEGDGPDFKDCDMSNQYFGITAENQEWFDRRCAELADGFGGPKPEWMNLWLSVEPLLGPIDLMSGGALHWFKWVVVGCESGPDRRKCGMGWIHSIVAQCQSAGVPVFVKQICLPDGRFTNRIEEFPAELRIRQVPWAKKGEE